MFAGNLLVRSNWNPLVWYDAADVSTIVEVNGRVSEWGDKSGNNRHLKNDTRTADRPVMTPNVLNGQSVIGFDGDVLESPFLSTTSITVGIVCQKTGIRSNAFDNIGFLFDIGVISAPNNTGRFLQLTTDNTAWSAQSAYHEPKTVSNPETDFVWRIVVIQFDISTGLSYFEDGQLIDSLLFSKPIMAGTPVIRVGMGNTWSGAINTAFNLGFVGNIAELIVFPGQFSASKLTGYFSGKWALLI